MADTQTILSQPTAAYLYHIARDHITGKVLDVGCGSKPYKWMFDCEEYVGLDIRPVGDIEADAHEMPIPDGEYDSVLIAEVLHVCPSPVTVMREVARVLKPGGKVVITAPSNYAEDDHSLYGFHIRGLEYICYAAGLEVLSLTADGQSWSMEWTDHKTYIKYGVPAHPETDGWLAQMNERYPAVSFAVARKPAQSNAATDEKES